MNTCISGSHFMRATVAILQIGCGLVLFGYAMASHAAQAERDNSTLGVDLLTIPLAYSVSKNDMPSEPGINLPDHFGLGRIPSLPAYLGLKKVASWETSIRWHVAEENNRDAFSPRLQVEFKETLILIKPVNRSVTFEWHRALD